MKRSAGFFILFALIFFGVFRSLMLNLSTNLISWGDGPYVIWVLFQNIQKIVTLNFQNFFNTNAFYPHPLTLLFSDILLPQSLIALPFTFFVGNPILIFNILFVITFFLNYASSFLFWKKIFKKNPTAFLGALFTAFSPFTFQQIGHFQMISFWPFFFSFWFILKSEEEKGVQNSICAGVFLALQFLASVYLSVFLLCTIFIFYVSRWILTQKKQESLRNFFVIILCFVLIDGIFIKGYMDMKKIYHVKRSINEYILYSAHLSDYVFTTGGQSLLYSSGPMIKWNLLDKHSIGERATFPGFLFSTLAFFGIFIFQKKKKSIEAKINLNSERLFFFMLLVIGLLNSLGPRLSFNGSYAHIPTPYAFFLKYIPLFESIRALARWSFLFYIGTVYFALSSLTKINVHKRVIVFIIVMLLFFVEYLPFDFGTASDSYITADYQILRNYCSKRKKVLLEFPVTHLNMKGGVGVGLPYVTKIELASLYHSCYIVNGYSGYDMPELQQMDTTINGFLENDQPAMFVNYLKNKNIDFVKINMDKINVKVDGGFYDKMGITPLSKNLYKVSK